MSPFVTSEGKAETERDFVLDEPQFLAELAEMTNMLNPPAFLADPSPEFLEAIELLGRMSKPARKP